MLFFTSSSKTFPIFTFVIGLNLGVIVTYLYISSTFADSPALFGGVSHNSDMDIEILDLDNTEEMKLHQSK